jgi:hypothetical protein
VVSTILSFTGSYRTLGVLRTLDQSATQSLERMTRDIRGASSINLAGSSLGTSPGTLELVSTQGAHSTTTRFYVDSGALTINVNTIPLGSLTASAVRVTDLVFHRMENTNTQAVKIDMTLEASRGPVTETKTYHATVILKGS